MTKTQVFVINGEEPIQEQSSPRRNGSIVRKSDNGSINYWSGFHVFTILCCCGSAMSILTLIPRHNSIIEQSYWFEIQIVTAITYLFTTAVTVLDFTIMFPNSSLDTIRLFLKNYLANFLAWVVGFCTSYLIRTMILENSRPMSWISHILFFTTKIVSVVSLPLMLPRDFSSGQEENQKLRKFVWYQLGFSLPAIFRHVIMNCFKKLENSDVQCILAFLIPISKRFTVVILSKLMNGIVGNDDERANVTLASHINLLYGLFIAIALVGGRPATVVCMVTIDALMQLIMTYQIVKLHKKIIVEENGISKKQMKKQKRKAILKLVLAELCEGLIPLAYALALAMAYYGPNAEVLGYLEVENISRTFLAMFGLFLMDIVCLALNSSVIWIFCKVNLFQEFCSVLQKYWYILALKMVSDVWWNFYGKDVNLGIKPEAIRNDTYISLASNKTDI